MRFPAILLLTLLLPTQAPRTTIIARTSEPPGRNFSVIHYDDAFLFVERHFGSSSDPAGQTTPGLFVHSKERKRWIRISAISTSGGFFGSSMSSDPEAAKKLSVSQASWDFSGAGTQPYIDQPLRTSGAIAFPDQIEYDQEHDRYVLRYFSGWGVASAEVVLYVARSDLRKAFVGR